MAEEYAVRLFLGGPWHEREVTIPEDRHVYRVWGPLSGEVRYRRVRMAYYPTRVVRSVMVPDHWIGREAEDALREYLLTRWVQRWGRSERPHRGNAAGASEVVPDDWQEQLFRRWVEQLPDA